MEIVIIIVAAIVFYKIVYWLTHRRPLTEEELERLSKARRIVRINEIYTFTHAIIKVNVNYRSSLNKEGRWDRISVPLTEILSLLTQLLRYKRHEWSVWCLADENECKFLWANKGDDNESCYFKGSMTALFSIAESSGCNTLIHMHNHPHTAERTWNLLSPSDTDLETLENMKKVCTEMGLNFVDALCSQKDFIIYGYSFSEQYWPTGSSVEEVRRENGISEWKNYCLHKELCKIKNKRIEGLK